MDGAVHARKRPRRRLKSVTERLLQDGRVVDDPTPEERSELGRLDGELGLIAVSWRRYFLCVDHNDDADLLHARKRSCVQKIELDGVCDDGERVQLEDDLRYVCEECGRAHWPIRRRRTLYDRAVVSMPMEKVEAFFNARVLDLDPDAERINGRPVYRLRVAGTPVHVCLLDLCTDTPYATLAFASSQPIVFVTASPRIYLDRFPGGDDWTQPLALHDLVLGGSAALGKRLGESAQVQYPAVLRDAPARAYLPLRQPGPRVVRERLGRHVLTLHERTASLDDVEVLSSRASGQLPVLRALVEQWREDIAAGRPRDSHRRLTLDQVLGRMEAAGVERTSDVESVRRAINRIRTGIPQAYTAATGIVIDENAVVEGSDGYGYRINAENVTVDVMAGTCPTK